MGDRRALGGLAGLGWLAGAGGEGVSRLVGRLKARVGTDAAAAAAAATGHRESKGRRHGRGGGGLLAEAREGLDWTGSTGLAGSRLQLDKREHLDRFFFTTPPHPTVSTPSPARARRNGPTQPALHPETVPTQYTLHLILVWLDPESSSFAHLPSSELLPICPICPSAPLFHVNRHSTRVAINYRYLALPCPDPFHLCLPAPFLLIAASSLCSQTPNPN